MQQTRLNGRYELIEKLGEGGVAVVYRAQDTLLDRTVAVKILREQLTGDPAFLERFRREAQAAARLSHPNIISIYDVGQDNGQYYIVMEYIAGQDLKAFIAAHAPLPTGQALAITEQVCSALDHAHRQGFVHRDIKPQNILVTAESISSGAGQRTAEAPQVKVADFGLARSMSSVTSSTGALVLGTIQYMSPEQARGEVATPASDIYSLGVVLYEMLTGRLPFTSDTPVGLALKHIQEEPLPPSRLNPRLPPTVDALVLRAMAKQPEKRFASAGEMGAALAAYRQFGEQSTGRFQPVQPGQLAQAMPRPAPAVATRPAPPRPPVAAAPAVVRAPARPVRRQGFDWLLLVLLLVTFIAIAGLVPLAFAVRDAVFPPAPTPMPQSLVPSLIGVEQAVAESQLQGLGLTLVVQEGRFDDNILPQRIIAQLIPAGTPLGQGQTVPVIVSRGRAQAKVPPLVGLTIDEAQVKLSALGLSSSRTDQPSTQIQAGIVMVQDPAAESNLARGSQVHLTVSVGDRVVVPNVFGKPEAEAQRLLDDAGLSTTFPNAQAVEDVAPQNRWVFDVVPVGGVISQTPDAGTLVERAAMVKIAIRKR